MFGDLTYSEIVMLMSYLRGAWGDFVELYGSRSDLAEETHALLMDARREKGRKAAEANREKGI